MIPSTITYLCRRALPVCIAVAVLSACATPTDAGDNRDAESPRVTAPNTPRASDDYTFELEQTCGEQGLTGRFLVTVEGGQVADASGLDPQGALSIEGGAGQYIPTLKEMPAVMAEMNALPGGSGRAVYDKETGELSRVDLDYNANATDDETCYVITNVIR